MRHGGFENDVVLSTLFFYDDGIFVINFLHCFNGKIKCLSYALIKVDGWNTNES